MEHTTYRQQMLQHCLDLAKLDSAFAVQQAGWYEAGQPQRLENLQAKVRQEIRRAATTGPAESSSTSTSPATAKHAAS